MAINIRDKYSTRIDGLDSLFYGGIHLKNNYGKTVGNKSLDGDGGLLIMNRGVHGVNKIHLAMQMCEGLHLSILEKKAKEGEYTNTTSMFKNVAKDAQKDLLFVSLNKNTERLRDTYIGYYLQRLIDKYRIGIIDRGEFKMVVNQFGWEPKINSEEIESIKNKRGANESPGSDVIPFFIVDCIHDGVIFYDERLCSLCLKSNSGDDPPLYTLDMEKTARDLNVVFVGRKDDELYDDNIKNDVLKSFDKMIGSLKKLYEERCGGKGDDAEQKKIRDFHDKIQSNEYLDSKTKIDYADAIFKQEKRKKPFDCVMIDGFSRLNETEIAQCPFHILSDTLRNICKIGIITVDDKMPPTAITVDVVIDMEIHEENHPNCVQHRLKISKCLYQKIVYGWHSYKMRRTGIEIIPSIHFQMNSRFHMDNAVQNACFNMDQIPYRYGIVESDGILMDYNLPDGTEDYRSLKRGYLYALSVDKIDNGRYLLRKVEGLAIVSGGIEHFLFLDLSRTRKEFYDKYHEQMDVFFPKNKKQKYSIHLFNFRPGHIHDDDFLYTIEKQVKAILRKDIWRAINNNNKEDVDDFVDKSILIKKATSGGETHYIINENNLWKIYNRIHLVIGDINYINFAYPCLNRDNLLLPAISNFTKKYHMTNFIYSTASWEISILEKEKELYQQMKVVSTMLF